MILPENFIDMAEAQAFVVGARRPLTAEQLWRCAEKARLYAAGLTELAITVCAAAGAEPVASWPGAGGSAQPGEIIYHADGTVTVGISSETRPDMEVIIPPSLVPFLGGEK